MGGGALLFPQIRLRLTIAEFLLHTVAPRLPRVSVERCRVLVARTRRERSGDGEAPTTQIGWRPRSPARSRPDSCPMPGGTRRASWFIVHHRRRDPKWWEEKNCQLVLRMAIIANSPAATKADGVTSSVRSINSACRSCAHRKYLEPLSFIFSCIHLALAVYI